MFTCSKRLEARRQGVLRGFEGQLDRGGCTGDSWRGRLLKHLPEELELTLRQR